MIPNTQSLLMYTPTEAVLVIANETLGLSMSPDNVDIVSVQNLGGTLTEITVSAEAIANRPKVAVSSVNPYTGQLSFKIHRLDLSVIFGDPYVVDVAAPTTVDGVLTKITALSGIIFDEHDFLQDRIDGSTYRLNAAPGSRRWVGGIDLVLNSIS